jgi:outer membrane murein-binding lipoprotein Lpp
VTDRTVILSRSLAAVAPGLLLAGCISVNAPDKPIVIELNVNIKQEVVYRLSADANKTIENNKDIF